MHKSSQELMQSLFNKYIKRYKNLDILDVGSMDVNGTYKNIFKDHKYTGLDISAGKNVDIVAKSEYDWGVPFSKYEVLISGQTLEHVTDIYRFAKQCYSITDWWVIIIAPNTFPQHRYPVDCWRIFPDGMRYLFNVVGGFKEIECNCIGCDTYYVGKKGIHRWDIINFLIDKYDYKSYLEIGLCTGSNFRKIDCEKKISVDPSIWTKPDHQCTSDQFFFKNKDKFDIVFIDGLHMESQVTRDILNAINILNDNGTIVLHDCNPSNEVMQLETWDHKSMWTGTVWKSIVKMKATRKDLSIFVVDTDMGCGIIRRGSQDLINIPNILSYNDLVTNRKSWLNLKNIVEEGL